MSDKNGQKQHFHVGIKAKLIMVIIPLQIATVFSLGFIASLSARQGISRVAIDAIGFKTTELIKYSQTQWDILIENNLSETESFLEASKRAIRSYIGSLLQSDTETVFALEKDVGQNQLAVSSRQLSPSEEEIAALMAIVEETPAGWVEFTWEGIELVGQTAYFAPFDWQVFITESKQVFYQEANQIIYQAIYLASLTLLVGIVISVFFISYTTRPMKRTVSAMQSIIQNTDLTTRVEVEENDEFGQMAQTFNVMVEELEHAYTQIKNFALQSVIAKRNESKIRNIFQKYVPTSVIEKFFQNPESLLIGENRELAILFTDIRSFTTISEGLQPEKMVRFLNQYFNLMVDIIVENGGIVDKYIGDAIMAIFGAPQPLKNSALSAIQTVMRMHTELPLFNKRQQEQNNPVFITGAGVVLGPVTIGNIGSEKKMDYTVIGDTVNLGARLESLTKFYKTSLLFSHSVYEQIHESLPCRLLDIVQVKGKNMGERVYTTTDKLSDVEKTAWNLHHEALDHYLQRDFATAIKKFTKVADLLPGDRVSELFIERSQEYQKNPPPKDWNGVAIMTEK